MSSAATQFETLTFDSTDIYIRAHAAVSTQPPPISNPFPPIPSSFPHPKLIPRTRFIIDGFRHAGDFSVSYFLSHFHSDHYTGLTPFWSKGIIYCSSITARLLIEVLKVPSSFVVPLPDAQRVVIDGCEVVLIDANHCPGAVQFLFKVPVDEGKFDKYVHTGDFRYSESMKLVPLLNEFIGSDAVFLDTTYCNPKYVFPGQQESINHVVEVVNRIGAENEGKVKNVLFLVATYVIGKEKILMEISRRCNRKIYVDSRKMTVLSVLGLGDSGMFTTDELESDVHVVGWNVLGETWPYFRPNFVGLKEIMEEKGYSKVVGFVPTGWTYEVKRTKFAVRTKDSFEIHLVPYSEHSNYEELREYVKFLKPKRVIPTVGIDVEKLDSKHVNKLTKHFAGLVDVMAAKQEFLMGFYQKTMEVDDYDTDVRASFPTDLVKPGNAVLLMEKECSQGLDMGGSGDSSLPQQEVASQGIETVNEVSLEESLQELSDCLPSWVTRNQMVDLLRSSRQSIVEAVSTFFEHETEYYEQVAATISPAKSQVKLSLPSTFAGDECTISCKGRGIESGVPSTSCPDNVFPKSPGVSLSERLKIPKTVNLVSSRSSPGKRKRAVENKASKKVKSNKSLNNAPKQHSITKFFQKVAPNTSQGDKVAAVTPHLQDDDTLRPSNMIENHNAEVDQFIEIVNGDESLRSKAAMILKQTNGNINLALDIYYDGSGFILTQSREILSDENVVVQTKSSDGNTSPENPKKEPGCSSGATVALEQIDIISVNHVSLSPENYSPIEHAFWKKGEPAPFLHLARTFDLVEEERGKIKATSILCNMFRSLLCLSPEDVIPTVYLCLNKIAPDHEKMELNIGGSIVVAALEDACGTNKSKVRELYNNLGDLGDVAQLCRQTQRLLAPPAVLSIRGVFSVLRDISSQTGTGSMVRKKNLILNLMRSCREKEMKFLVRMLVRNLRIGAMMRTVLPALAQAVAINSMQGSVVNLKDRLQGLSAAVVEAYNILPHLDLLIPSLMEKGLQFSSGDLSMVPGIPIKPMLAKITNGSSQVLKLFQNKAFTCEYKYDGQRAQIHRLKDGSLRIFSRKGDETTAKFPDVINIIKEACGSAETTFILDTEVVAVDRRKGMKLMSFQELSSRERGSKDSTVSLDKIKVDICVFIFDIMFVDGKQLLGTPLRQRRKYFKDLFHQEKPGYLEYAKEMTVEADDAYPDNETTLTAVNCFLKEALHSSCEGIMVKFLDVDAGYTPSKRSDAWLKVKKDYVDGLSDSLDLVPIGAWHGNGRKAGWYSPFLMACYDPEREEYQSVCRVMSGFSDSFYREMKEFFQGDKILAKKPPYYQTAEVPDMWFSPEIVWAIRGAELSVSPVHKAAVGLIHPSRGISMRFPRFIRSLSDRNPEDCSTAADIAEMFNSQTRKMDVNVEH
ncbi:OLC1v1010679C1 [Oldenlandia corymbosa var. corymbosa]|uniref:DNA ligase n=1 Tax=Oldenlandia corymbosa var. corymbosa TaxID=529605 RepID=A0AAV1DRZ0_OLDCO|nr:OLC1v1010679C1 [Oldenlandia corymbosa var. corymbosa]